MKSTVLAIIATATVARAQQSLESVAIAQHNAIRAKHGASPLTWSDDLASIAQGHTSSCQFMHKTDGGSYGQNLYQQSFNAGSSPDPVSCLSDGIATSWYANELPKFANNYGVAAPSAGFSDWGHYTQLVWKSTTEVGCAYTSCSGFLLFECNYRVAGNMAGQYANNVSPLGGGSTGSDDYPTTGGTTTGGNTAGSTGSTGSSGTTSPAAPVSSWGNNAVPSTGQAASNSAPAQSWGGWRRFLSGKRADH